MSRWKRIAVASTMITIRVFGYVVDPIESLLWDIAGVEGWDPPDVDPPTPE